MQHEKSKYELLREKNILAILDGDTDFGFLEINGENSNIKVAGNLCLEWRSAKQMGLYG